MIQSYFNATAESVKKRAGFDGYADPELVEIATDVECRKMRIDELKQDNEGKEVVSKIEVWLPASLDRLPSESTITFEGETHKVISSEFVPGLVVDQFQRVFLK